MVVECGSAGAAQWAGWILAVIALFVTAYGWRVRGEQVKKVAHQKDIHDSIDETIKAITEFEDAAYSFWTSVDPEIHPYQLILLHSRIRIRMERLSQLRGFDLPMPMIGELRKHATLDAETRETDKQKVSKRLRKLSSVVRAVMQIKALEKNWSF